MKQIKRSLFHGRWAAEVPIISGAPENFKFLGRGGSAASQTRVRVSSCEPLSTRPRLCLISCTHLVWKMIWLCSITLEDKSAKDKPPSVVGVSRLTLLDCLTTWVYLDNTRTRMRVLFYMVICASFYLDFRIFKVRSLRSRGGEIPEFASRGWACFDYQNNLQHIHTATCGATSAFTDAFYVHYSRMLFGYSCEKHPFF